MWWLIVSIYLYTFLRTLKMDEGKMIVDSVYRPLTMSDSDKKKTAR